MKFFLFMVPPLYIYGKYDISTDPHRAAGIGVLNPDIDLKENWQISYWTCTTGAVSVDKYHAIEKGSEQYQHLAVFTCSQGILFRLSALLPENLVARFILHQSSRLSEQGIQMSQYWIPSHISISNCDKVDQLVKMALSNEELYCRIPLSLKQKKKWVISYLWPSKNWRKIDMVQSGIIKLLLGHQYIM